MRRSTEILLMPMMRLMLTALGLHERATLLHSLRVAAIVAAVAPRIGLGGVHLEAAVLGALFHDIGKLHVPRDVLVKPDLLNAGEWATIVAHPHEGATMLERIGFGKPIANVACYHHERWDGSGYPLGLSGTLIPAAARLVAVVDAYDVMTTGRPYARVRSTSMAITELRAGAGSQWAPVTVQAVAAWAVGVRAPVAPLHLDQLPLESVGRRVSAAS